MFPDSDIAQQFSMGRTKSMYVINHGLAPLFKSQLAGDFEKSDIHIFSFDESLNGVIQTSEMGLFVRYWDVKTSQVKSWYYGPRFLRHAIHKDLKNTSVKLRRIIHHLSYTTHLWMVQMSSSNFKVIFKAKSRCLCTFPC